MLVSTRPVQRADLPAVLRMIEALAKHHGDQPSITMEALERDALEPNPWITILVAELDGEVVGYAGLVPLMQLQTGKRGMDMHHLYVSLEHRRRGVGRTLIAASLDEARRQRCRYVMVGTHPDNVAAQEVYLAVGFEQAATAGPRFGKRL